MGHTVNMQYSKFSNYRHAWLDNSCMFFFLGNLSKTTTYKHGQGLHEPRNQVFHVFQHFTRKHRKAWVRSYFYSTNKFKLDVSITKYNLASQ